MTGELKQLEQRNIAAIQDAYSDRGISRVEKLGEFIFKSGICGCKNLQQGIIMALYCICESANPVELSQKYHIIPSKGGGFTLTRSAESMHAEFLENGGRIKLVKSTDDECEMEFTHPVTCPSPYIVKKTYKEMEKKGYILGKPDKNGKRWPKDNWERNGKRMLQCRVLTDGIHFAAPGIATGMITPEEAADVFVEHSVDTCNNDNENENEKAEMTNEEKLSFAIRWFEKRSWIITKVDLENFIGGDDAPVPLHEWDDDDFTEISKWMEHLSKIDASSAENEIVSKCRLCPGSLG